MEVVYTTLSDALVLKICTVGG